MTMPTGAMSACLPYEPGPAERLFRQTSPPVGCSRASIAACALPGHSRPRGAAFPMVLRPLFGRGSVQDIMDVGAADFGRSLPLLRGRLRRAAFLAFDMEFTGLYSASLQSDKLSLFDSPVERYLKAKQSVQHFTITQLGLAIFSNESSNKYVVHSYNFFLFPSTWGVTDVEFTLSASSIQFLSHYGFDYNKFLKDGIPYMNEAQEKILHQHLLEGSRKVSSALDRDVLKKAIDEVTCWIAKAEEEETMILQDLSGYQMIEVQLVLRQALQNVWTQPLGIKKVMVKKVSPQHRQLLENSPYDCCQKELILLSARGFTNLFQMLVQAKKPLVGHNMLMDLMHLHDKFYKPLPESYEEFKRNIHSLFPVLIDTKTVTKSIWKECHFPRVASLMEVYAVLCSGAVEADPSFPRYLSVLAEYLNKVNFIRGGVSSIVRMSGRIFPGKMFPATIPISWLSMPEAGQG